MQMVIRLLVAAVFLWAAINKQLSHTPLPVTLYDEVIAHHRILGFLIPIGEGALALWLLLGVKVRYSAMLVVIVLSVYTGLILRELGSSYPQPCGCLGAAAAMYEPAAIRRSLLLDLARNALLGFGSVYLFMAAAGTVQKRGTDEILEPATA